MRGRGETLAAIATLAGVDARAIRALLRHQLVKPSAAETVPHVVTGAGDRASGADRRHLTRHAAASRAGGNATASTDDDRWPRCGRCDALMLDPEDRRRRLYCSDICRRDVSAARMAAADITPSQRRSVTSAARTPDRVSCDLGGLSGALLPGIVGSRGCTQSYSHPHGQGCGDAVSTRSSNFAFSSMVFLAEPLAALMVGRQREDLAFPTVTPHDRRHTAASLAISAGANVKAVQTMLGHASAVLTLDTYADLFADDLEQVSVALDVARTKSLKSAADQLRTATKEGPELDDQSEPSTRLYAVGVAGFEPTTSSSRTKHATKLRHTPRKATTAYRTGHAEGQTLIAGPLAGCPQLISGGFPGERPAAPDTRPRSPHPWRRHRATCAHLGGLATVVRSRRSPR
jgi:hypothetical protein